MASKKHFYVSLGITFWLTTALFAILPFWPHFYYRLLPQTSAVLASTLASTIPNIAVGAGRDLPVSDGDSPSDIQNPKPEIVLPDVDPTLPAENGLIVDKIGVRGSIHEGDDWENLLKQGIWRVPNFGTPIENTTPVILAAHRWGYLEWSSSFRKLNSFYNLPQLKIGDSITVVWDQRPFMYTVYATGTGTEITDYSANLILYTCQLWNSPVRFFVYASRNN